MASYFFKAKYNAVHSDGGSSITVDAVDISALNMYLLLTVRFARPISSIYKFHLASSWSSRYKIPFYVLFIFEVFTPLKVMKDF